METQTVGGAVRFVLSPIHSLRFATYAVWRRLAIDLGQGGDNILFANLNVLAWLEVLIDVADS
jgi:hypothetical protein